MPYNLLYTLPCPYDRQSLGDGTKIRPEFREEVPSQLGQSLSRSRLSQLHGLFVEDILECKQKCSCQDTLSDLGSNAWKSSISFARPGRTPSSLVKEPGHLPL